MTGVAELITYNTECYNTLVENNPAPAHWVGGGVAWGNTEARSGRFADSLLAG
jgi:hypothetical protein